VVFNTNRYFWNIPGDNLKKFKFDKLNSSFDFQFVLAHVLAVDFLYSNVLFALLNLIAVTIFLEMWKRRLVLSLFIN
jgi:hypothetical protein